MFTLTPIMCILEKGQCIYLELIHGTLLCIECERINEYIFGRERNVYWMCTIPTPLICCVEIGLVACFKLIHGPQKYTITGKVK